MCFRDHTKTIRYKWVFVWWMTAPIQALADQVNAFAEDTAT